MTKLTPSYQSSAPTGKPNSRMAALLTAAFEGHNITIVGTPDQPWFVARDICNALGIVDTTSLRALDPEDKSTAICGTGGGNQHRVTVNESGMYSLILRSRKPEAKRFKRWVTSEVLPQIRKSGIYCEASAKALAATTEVKRLESRLRAYANWHKLRVQESVIVGSIGQSGEVFVSKGNGKFVPYGQEHNAFDVIRGRFELAAVSSDPRLAVPARTQLVAVPAAMPEPNRWCVFVPLVAGICDAEAGMPLLAFAERTPSQVTTLRVFNKTEQILHNPLRHEVVASIIHVELPN
jgi:prophage antirepressor-like protein